MPNTQKEVRLTLEDAMNIMEAIDNDLDPLSVGMQEKWRKSIGRLQESIHPSSKENK